MENLNFSSTNPFKYNQDITNIINEINHISGSEEIQKNNSVIEKINRLTENITKVIQTGNITTILQRAQIEGIASEETLKLQMPSFIDEAIRQIKNESAKQILRDKLKLYMFLSVTKDRIKEKEGTQRITAEPELLIDEKQIITHATQLLNLLKDPQEVIQLLKKLLGKQFDAIPNLEGNLRVHLKNLKQTEQQAIQENTNKLQRIVRIIDGFVSMNIDTWQAIKVVSENQNLNRYEVLDLINYYATTREKGAIPPPFLYLIHSYFQAGKSPATVFNEILASYPSLTERQIENLRLLVNARS